MSVHILDQTLAHEKMLRGFGQTTAEVTYRRPLEKEQEKEQKAATTLFGLESHGEIISLQVFTWQFEDLAPKFPRLISFLEYWDKHCSIAPIERVRFAHAKLIVPRELRYTNSRWYIN
jgi:uncharacterized protein Usg